MNKKRFGFISLFIVIIAPYFTGILAAPLFWPDPMNYIDSTLARLIALRRTRALCEARSKNPCPTFAIYNSAEYTQGWWFDVASRDGKTAQELWVDRVGRIHTGLFYDLDKGDPYELLVPPRSWPLCQTHSTFGPLQSCPTQGGGLSDEESASLEAMISVALYERGQRRREQAKP